MNKYVSNFGRRYDTNTILLHWTTAGIVIFQFLTAELWDYFPRSQKHLLILSHMSLGFLLTFILAVRIIWRLTFGIKIPETSPTIFDQGAKALHVLLYMLLVVQMPLGFFTRWTDNQPLYVFGLLIPSPLGPCSKTAGHFIDQIHDINAWVVMGLVGIHTMAALVHHFMWRDEVLQRMLPSQRRF